MSISTPITAHDGAAISQAAADIAEHGFTVIPDVLDQAESARVLERLWQAAEESERRGLPTYAEGLDPNPSNVRVWNLTDLDPVSVS